MNETITRQARDMLAAASKAEVPSEVRAIAEDGVAKAREAYAIWTAAVEAGVKAMEELATVTQMAAKTMGDKVAGNTVANTEAAFAAAERLARAKTLPEAAQLQARFAQDQLALAGVQGKELFDLSTQVAKETAETLSAIAAKTANSIKKIA